MTSTSYTAFGNIYKLVHNFNNLIGYTDGITGTTKLVKDATLNSTNLKLDYGNGTIKNIDFSTISSKGSVGNGVDSIEKLSNILYITLTDGSVTELNLQILNGPQGIPGGYLDNSLKFTAGSDDFQIVQNAYHDYISILPINLEDRNITLVLNEPSGNYNRFFGKVLRFYNKNPVTSDKVYNILEKLPTNQTSSISDWVIVLTIRPQEAYSMVWSNDQGVSRWINIPGIINAKSKEIIDADFEALPTSYESYIY